MKYQSENSRQAAGLGDVRIIGGKPYRTGFLNAIWGFLGDNDPQILRRARRENVLAISQNFYHYTSLSGLKGIVEEKGFWASDNRFMNDTEESWNGIRLARKLLQHKAKRARHPAFARILQSVDELIAAPKQDGHLIACFSTARDDLGQWRGYASGGVCLCLGPSDEGEAPLFFGPEHLPYEAIYEDTRKRVLLLSVIRSFEREYALDRSAMVTDWPENHDENYVMKLHSQISSSILGFKDQAFQNEAEARIVLSYQQVDRYDSGLRFRISPLGIIPYLRTGDHLATKKHGGRLPLRELIVGPAPHQELIAQSIETFLMQSGYPGVPVSLSKVPYRTP